MWAYWEDYDPAFEQALWPVVADDEVIDAGAVNLPPGACQLSKYY